MQSIFSRFQCKFNYPLSSASWQWRHAKEPGVVERFVHNRTSSIPGRGGSSVQMRNFKLLAVEKDEPVWPETAAVTNERIDAQAEKIWSLRSVIIWIIEHSLLHWGFSVRLINNKRHHHTRRTQVSSGAQITNFFMEKEGTLSSPLTTRRRPEQLQQSYDNLQLYVAPTPGGMGYASAAQRFLKILAVVWAGSQVTKLPRAAGALALAPLVDRGLSQITEQFKFKSRGQAFGTIIAMCVGLVLLLFVVVTMLWA